MRLIFDPPGRPQDRLDVDGELIGAGESFDVSGQRARQLLAELHPDVREAPPPPVRRRPARRRARAQ